MSDLGEKVSPNAMLIQVMLSGALPALIHVGGEENICFLLNNAILISNGKCFNYFFHNCCCCKHVWVCDSIILWIDGLMFPSKNGELPGGHSSFWCVYMSDLRNAKERVFFEDGHKVPIRVKKYMSSRKKGCFSPFQFSLAYYELFCRDATFQLLTWIQFFVFVFFFKLKLWIQVFWSWNCT